MTNTTHHVLAAGLDVPQLNATCRQLHYPIYGAYDKFRFSRREQNRERQRGAERVDTDTNS